MKVRYAIVFAMALFAAGCGDGGHMHSIEQKNFQLQQDNSQLKRDLEKTRSDNKQLKKQLESAINLDSATRLSGLYEIKSVNITRYTNFYDKDKDGSKEKLIVYIQPVDSVGDTVKAPGEASVELWDLSKKTGAMLAKWDITAEEMKKLWISSIKTNYRFVFDITKIIKNFDEPLTVKVTFTDYISGKVFTEQHVIKP